MILLSLTVYSCLGLVASPSWIYFWTSHTVITTLNNVIQFFSLAVATIHTTPPFPSTSYLCCSKIDVFLEKIFKSLQNQLSFYLSGYSHVKDKGSYGRVQKQLTFSTCICKSTDKFLQPFSLFHKLEIWPYYNNCTTCEYTMSVCTCTMHAANRPIHQTMC